MDAGRFEEAVAVGALERAPVPEAHALYREAEVWLMVDCPCACAEAVEPGVTIPFDP